MGIMGSTTDQGSPCGDVEKAAKSKDCLDPEVMKQAPSQHCTTSGGELSAAAGGGHSHWLTAVGHIITANVGAGVLGLPSSVARLGWIGGMLALVFFFAVSLWTSMALTEVYMVNGCRHTRYKYAVLHIMGARHSLILSLAQHVNMVLTSIGYHIVSADSMSYIAKRVCEGRGTPIDQCWDDGTYMTLVIGAVQLLMSQLPNLEAAWWASAIGATMSLGYCGIAIGLGASEAKNGLGSLAGRPAAPAQKMFEIFSALGNLGFAFTCTTVLLEVQDTLREPPAAVVSMKKAVPFALLTTFVLYLGVTVTGYAALGDDVTGSILLSFAAAPGWAVILANLFVLIHMISAYQIYAQPVFATAEDLLLREVPKLNSMLFKRNWVLRMVVRSMYVAMTTVVSCALPFFSSFVGLVGALSFWPTAVFYPIQMWRRVYQPHGVRSLLLTMVNVIMGCVALVATVGSIETIVALASHFKPFAGGGGGHGR